jgi:DNA (cytosine-5)-methyltransferase 1
MKLTSIEVCAGAGGQALGLERAGFEHVALLEIEPQYCSTLKLNRPHWEVIEGDMKTFSMRKYAGKVDLFAGGVPCPPFSKAGKQLGQDDERDLFPAALRMVEEINPKAVLLENVRGLMDPKFSEYRLDIQKRLEELGYVVHWRLLHSAHFGVPQLRPRTIMVALKEQFAEHFEWPTGDPTNPVTVADALYDEMASKGWKGVDEWAKIAVKVAPTLVGGSKKHGGADLGPTRAKQAWSMLGVNGKGLAEEAPHADHEGLPKLTVPMAALIQGFPKEWKISGKKTSAYRQVGNAFPPPVAEAVGSAIKSAIEKGLSPQSSAARQMMAAPLAA